jgi:hypothetical protein
MNQYLLMLHETPAAYAGISPAEMAAIIERYAAWAQALGERGQLAGGHKLTEDGGVRLSRRNGKVLASDGPYAESKDVVGGFFLINAVDDAEAQRIAEGCPHLDFGDNWIELRRIDPRGG